MLISSNLGEGSSKMLTCSWEQKQEPMLVAMRGLEDCKYVIIWKYRYEKILKDGNAHFHILCN